MSFVGSVQNICRKIPHMSALFVAASLAACSSAGPPTFPVASTPSNYDPNAIVGSCVWMEGSQVIGKGYVAADGDKYWSDGKTATALFDNGMISAEADYTSSLDYVSNDPQHKRHAGLRIDGVRSYSEAVGTPSDDYVRNTYALAAVIFHTRYVISKSIKDNDLSEMGHQICEGPPSYIGGGGYGNSSFISAITLP